MKMKTVMFFRYNPACDGIVKAILEKLPESERENYENLVQRSVCFLWTMGQLGMQANPHCWEKLKTTQSWGEEEGISQLRKDIANRFRLPPKALANRMLMDAMTIAAVMDLQFENSTKESGESS